MREYFYQRGVRWRSRPAFILLYILMVLGLGCAGPLFFWISIPVLFLRFGAISHAQVEYFLPRTEEEIKRQSIVNVAVICMETTVSMLLWGGISLTFYQNMGVLILKFPVFIVLWMTAMLLVYFQIGIGMEQRRWSGGREPETAVSNGMKKDILEIITIFLNNVFLIFFLGMIFYLEWMGIGKWDYQNPVILVMIVLAMVFTAIDIRRSIRAWTIADFDEYEKRES